MNGNELEVTEYKKGDIITRQGDVEMCMYDILYGSVGIYLDYGTKNEKLLKVLDGDGYFGEIGLVEARARTATAVAMEKTGINIITTDTFSSFFRERPAKVMSIMQSMSKRIRELTNDYMDACKAVNEALEDKKNGKEHSSWVSKTLKKLSDNYKGE